jgi:hypothetical protein
MSDEKTVEVIGTPEGRLINGSLFEKETYTDDRGVEGTPAYKIEMAFDPEDVGGLETKVIEAAVEKWGPQAEQDYLDGKIRDPLKDGDELAAARVAKGKKGDAYEGKIVIRANTIWNKHGEDGPGGISVYKEDGATELVIGEYGTIFNGCMGVAALTVHAYDGIGGGQPGVKFYLSAFQKTGEGERLMGERDYSQVFKPVGRTEGATAGRKKRAG